MKIALLQINPTVGDLAGNARLIRDAAARRRCGGRRSGRHARARAGRLPAARSAAQPGLRRAAAGTPSSELARDAGRPAAGAGRPARAESVRRGPAALQQRGAAARRPRRAALPQGAAADLRRLRRGPLLRAVSRRRRLLDLAGTRLGISICEDVWNDRDFWKRRRYHHDPIDELVARRRRRRPQPVGLAVLGRQAPAARRDAGQHGAQASRCRSSTSTSSAATTIWSSTAAAACSAPTARSFARGRSFDDDVVIVRSLDATRPIGARGRSRRRVRDLARAGARHARLRAQVRLQTRGARSLGRHRLGADRGDRRRSARRRQRARRADAVAVTPAAAASTTRTALAANLGIDTMTLPIEPADARVRRHAARRARRRSTARRDRGEHPGAHPRQPADGAVEQVRRAAAHDRQQVRAGGRLLHALRRHVRRAGGDRRRAEDDGLSCRALAQSTARTRP